MTADLREPVQVVRDQLRGTLADETLSATQAAALRVALQHLDRAVLAVDVAVSCDAGTASAHTALRD